MTHVSVTRFNISRTVPFKNEAHENSYQKINKNCCVHYQFSTLRSVNNPQ